MARNVEIQIKIFVSYSNTYCMNSHPIGLYASEYIGDTKQTKPSNNEPSKVNQLLNRINGKRRSQTPRYRPADEPTVIDDADTDDYNFNPPQHPVSAGINRNSEQSDDFPINPDKLQSNPNDFNTIPDLDIAYADNNAGSQPNNNLLKGYPSNNSEYVSNRASSAGDMVKKIDYLIHMMEEQQDQKTGHVTEELILYSFVGIFIIFTIDSFTKVGTYSR